MAARGRVRPRGELGLVEAEVLDLPLSERRVRAPAAAARAASEAAPGAPPNEAAPGAAKSLAAHLAAPGAAKSPAARAAPAEAVGGVGPADVSSADVEWWRARSAALHQADAEAVDDDVRGVAFFCGCFTIDHPLRQWCLGLLRWPWFDRGVLVFIMVNSVMLGAQDPQGDASEWAVVSDLVFNILFALEVCVKVIGLGAWGGEGAYFRDAWNRFDFFTVCVGWLPYALCVSLARNPGQCFTGRGDSAATLNLNFLRVIKVVKVLKTVQRIPGMRCLFVSLFKAAPLLVQVLEVLGFIFFVFGAIGVQLFQGKLRQRCVSKETFVSVDEDICTKEPAWGGHRCGRGEECSDRNARGKAFDGPDGLNKYISFDNILFGFATVLSTMSLEGWSNTMFALMDALGPVVVVYFVLLILIGAFFVVNLIVAVIYQAYVAEEVGKAPAFADVLTRFDGDAEYDARPPSDARKCWRKPPGAAGTAVFPDRFADLAGIESPWMRGITKRWWQLRDGCCAVANLESFSRGIVCCILFSTIMLMAEHESQSKAQSLFTCRANDILTYVFIAEMFIKMLGTAYVFDAKDGGFNTFDGVITVASVVDLVVSSALNIQGCASQGSEESGGGDASALQVLRVGRVLRLVRIFRSFRIIRKWKSMAHIMSAVVRSGPALVNFSCLLIVFSWVYALAGMQMYAGKFIGSAGRKSVRPRTNFDSLYGALLTVFIVVSGENWDEILDLAYRANGSVGLLFIISMYWLGNIVVLNIFLAILLSNFDTAVGGSETLYDQLEESNELTSIFRAFRRGCDRCTTALRLRAASSPKFGRCAAGFARLATAVRGVVALGAFTRYDLRRSHVSDTATDVDAFGCKLSNVNVKRFDDVADANEATTQEIVEQMQAELRLSTCHRGRREYFDCFSGSVAVDWLLEAAFAADADGAVLLGQRLLDERLICKAEGSAARKFQSLIARARRTQLALQASAAQRAAAQQRVATSRWVNGSPASPNPRALGPHGTPPLGTLPLGSPNDACDGLPTAAAVPASVLPEEDKFADDHVLYRFCARHAHRLHLVGDSSFMTVKRAARDERKRELKKQKLLASGPSYGLFTSESYFRQFSVKCVLHPAFDGIAGLLIVVSSVLLAADHPERHLFSKAFLFADITLTVAFNVEFLLKSVSSGLGVYLKSGWNCLDFIIVVVSNASFVLADTDLSYLKALRALRALRPLRMIQRYPAMKTVVDALFDALPDVLNVGLVVVGFFCIFAVVGGTLFRGSLDWCHLGPRLEEDCLVLECDYSMLDEDDFAYAEYFGRYSVDKVQCREWSRSGVSWAALPSRYLSKKASEASPLRAEWKALRPNFDDVFAGLLALFQLATLEGWPAQMYAAMDVTTSERAPRRNANAPHALFYVCFVVLGSFFVMNIFVGVVVHKFQLSKERTDGAHIFLTAGQRAFVAKIKHLLDTGRPARLRLPRESWRRSVFYVVVSEAFEMAVICVILLNCVTISMQHYDQSARWTFALDTVANTVFALLFASEMLLKMTGLGARQYSKDNWNKFDAFIVATSLVDMITSFSGASRIMLNLKIFRILRLVRVVKLVNVNSGLKALLKSLIVSLPSLMNVGSLLLLLIYVYSCIGMNMYYRVPRGGAVTEYVNFETFGYSMLTLFRCLTGEDWNKLMQQVVDDANRYSAYAFFPSFMVLGNFMLLNLCVAVILEAFAEFMHTAAPSDSDSDSERGRRELRDHVAQFKAVWMRHDAEASLFIPAYRFAALMQDLPWPLGLVATDPAAAARRSSFTPAVGRKPADDETELYRLTSEQRDLIDHVRALRIKVNEAGDLFYLDVLMAVVFRAGDYRAAEHLGGIEDDSTMELNVILLRSMDTHLRDQMRKHAFRHDLPELDLTHMINAAVTLQEFYRARKQSEFRSSTLSQAGVSDASPARESDAPARDAGAPSPVPDADAEDVRLCLFEDLDKTYLEYVGDGRAVGLDPERCV